MEITFSSNNKIERIEAEKVSPEEIILAMKNVQEAPLWLQTPAQRESDTQTTSLVETHRLHDRETLGSVLEDIEETVSTLSTLREDRLDDPLALERAIDDLEITIAKAQGSAVNTDTPDETATVPNEELDLIIRAADREIDAMGDAGEDIYQFCHAYRQVKSEVSKGESSEITVQPLGLLLEAADREIEALEQTGGLTDELNDAYNVLSEAV